jgi:probable HAF family extracellular repeat protein
MTRSPTGETTADGINATGLIVGGYSSIENATHGFIYNPGTGTYSTIDYPGALNTLALGINNAGQIVGEYLDKGAGQHGFLLSGGLFTTIDEPFGTQGTVARGINNFGQIVGSYRGNDGHEHGFIYNPSNGSFATLDDPVGFDTAAVGLNDSGQIVGVYDGHGFLYNGGTYITLDAPNSAFTVAVGINNAGVISGFYFGPGPNPPEHGFILNITPNPPPPPGTTAVMILRAHNFTFTPGQYEIYDIGNNSLLAAYQLGTVGTDWQFVSLGSFFGSDTDQPPLSGPGGMLV